MPTRRPHPGALGTEGEVKDGSTRAERRRGVRAMTRKEQRASMVLARGTGGFVAVALTAKGVPPMVVMAACAVTLAAGLCQAAVLAGTRNAHKGGEAG